MTTFIWTIYLLDTLIDVFYYILHYEIVFYSLVFAKKPMFVFKLPKEIEYYFNSPDGNVKINKADALYIRPIGCDSWVIGYCCINSLSTPDINVIHPDHKESVPFSYKYSNTSARPIIDLLDHFFRVDRN